MTRPVDLPVPDDDVEEELEPDVPIQDQSSSHGSARGREPSRPRRNEKFNSQEKRKPVALFCVRFFDFCGKIIFLEFLRKLDFLNFCPNIFF